MRGFISIHLRFHTELLKIITNELKKTIIMKNLVIIIFLFLTTCNSDRDELLLAEYIESFNKTISIINRRNKLIYDDFNFGMTDLFYGHPQAIATWDKKATQLKQKSDSLYGFIDSIENLLSKKIIISPINITKKNIEILNEEKKLSKSNISLLELKFIQFQHSLIEVIGKDSALYRPVIKSVNKNLDIKSWQKVSCLKSNKSKLIEVLAVLAKLKMNVKLAESEMLSYLYWKINIGCFRFHKIAAIVEPNALLIQQGQAYTANIFIGQMDTTITPLIFVEDKPVKVRSGVGIYKEKVILKDTLIQRNGYFLLTNPVTRKPLKAPFYLEYEVIPD